MQPFELKKSWQRLAKAPEVGNGFVWKIIGHNGAAHVELNQQCIESRIRVHVGEAEAWWTMGKGQTQTSNSEVLFQEHRFISPFT